MKDVEAYDAACELLGAWAGVWSPDRVRFIVGRWVPNALQTQWARVLHGRRMSLVLVGEGPSWELALDAARIAVNGKGKPE